MTLQLVPRFAGPCEIARRPDQSLAFASLRPLRLDRSLICLLRERAPEPRDMYRTPAEAANATVMSRAA
jgi:hypothetical protein